MYIFEYFLLLKSWLWHSISIGNEICNTYKSCLKLLLPCCCLDKQKRQVHQKIAGLSLNQLFMNLRVHYSIFNCKYGAQDLYVDIKILFFDAYFKIKVGKKTNKYYTCTHFDQEREKQMLFSNFFCMSLNPNIFFQFEVKKVFCYQKLF